MKHNYLILIFFIFLSACVEEDILQVKSGEPQLVINGVFSPHEEISVHLSRSFGSGGKLADAVLEQQAIVRVYVNNHFVGNMSPDDKAVGEQEDEAYPKGRYRLFGIKPSAGDEVRVEAEYDGFPVAIATACIPNKPTLLSVDTIRYLDVTSTEVMRLYVKLKDSAVFRNYYRLLLSREITGAGAPEREVYPYLNNEYYLYPSSYFWYITYDDPVFTADQPIHGGTSQRNGNGVFTNTLFAGDEYVVKLAFTNPANSFKNDTLDYRVRYHVKLLGISDSYYNFYKQNAGMLLSVGPIQVIQPGEYHRPLSNVKNGLGFVTAYHETSYEINMPYDFD